MTETPTNPANPSNTSPLHDQDVINLVAEAQLQGKIAATESHGLETPGFISSAADAARETAIFLLLFGIPFFEADYFIQILQLLGPFVCGWALWKGGRSAWLGWFRLERLHRVLEQEKWEIEHHRQQERSELSVLYAAKGFKGKLLEEVLDVLMADDERLLRVMAEEELGLSLAAYEHPLKQGLGAFLGVIVAAVIFFGTLFINFQLSRHPLPYLWASIGSFIIIAIASAILAQQVKNRKIPAILWNVALVVPAYICVLFLYIVLHHYSILYNWDK